MNTKITVTYSNGSTREFIASDELEKLIDEGEMFSITTMHSDINIDEELGVSKMYAGNPMQALGHMMMMRNNAELIQASKEDDHEKMNIVVDVLNSCITFLSQEITSLQSNMEDPRLKDEVIN